MTTFSKLAGEKWPKEITKLNFDESQSARVSPEDGDWDNESQNSCFNKGFNLARKDCDLPVRVPTMQEILDTLKKTDNENGGEGTATYAQLAEAIRKLIGGEEE